MSATLPAFVLQRLGSGLLIIMAVVVFNFIILRLAPGDPALVMAGESGAADEQYVERIRAQYGLDQPLLVQLQRYLTSFVQLDLGFSYRQKRSNLALIAERLPATLLLTGTAYVLSITIGGLLGFIAARRRGAADHTINAASLVFHSMPIFWTGIMLILLFSVQLEWLPAFGMRSFIPKTGTLAQTFDTLRHLVLPAATLALYYLAVYARIMRASLEEVRHQDFVEMALAKGASESRVWRRHILRNALIPVVTMAGIQGGQIVGGSVLVETVFAWPGIGRLAYDAIFQRDYNLLLGVFLVTAICVVAFNIVTDLLYRLVDPRMTLQARGA